MSIPVVQYSTYHQATSMPQQAEQPTIKTKDYYVRVSKTRRKFHALKFSTGTIDIGKFNRPEMSRDTSNVPSRPDWENGPKSGQGSEFNKEAKELARRRKYGYVPKKFHAEDLPWLINTKGSEKEKTRDKQFIGKKAISENSCYFVFIKCADGGFEAHPLEDWYTFAPHKTYKTLDIDEAEEEFKRRHKILNKYMIMANKRKAEEGEEEETEAGVKPKPSKASTLSDEEDEGDKRKKKANSKPKKKANKKKKSEEDDAPKDMEDSDDGDREGMEKDYSDTGSEYEEPDAEAGKYDEKYEEKGIDEEEAIKAMERSSDEEEQEEDEDLTEEGKEYKKLMTKKDEDGDEEFDEFFKTGKLGKDEESKDSSSSFDEMDGEEGKKSKMDNKLKRKATDPLQKTTKKFQKTASGGLQAHDESSSSSTTSTAQTTKASKTAAIIAAVQAKSGNVAVPAPAPETSALTEEEVRRYLSRKPMTTKELLHKFRGKTQDKMSKEQLCQSLKTILDRLNAKIFEKNGVKYLSLS
ncbi:general transcription factor IIF subunit 1 [Brachionus plicatilis]|uniref:Transcription initiation factor IIF subunit alpha n=1 Tax=Brachionus plicatilis TaxID=10195 RepID=A0A3M7RHA0_BRAPC|nr:general transcription factor IIF subunit 1 [Brachionus plicatilis]